MTAAVLLATNLIDALWAQFLGHETKIIGAGRRQAFLLRSFRGRALVISIGIDMMLCPLAKIGSLALRWTTISRLLFLLGHL